MCQHTSTSSTPTYTQHSWRAHDAHDAHIGRVLYREGVHDEMYNLRLVGASSPKKQVWQRGSRHMGGGGLEERNGPSNSSMA